MADIIHLLKILKIDESHANLWRNLCMDSIIRVYMYLKNVSLNKLM